MSHTTLPEAIQLVDTRDLIAGTEQDVALMIRDELAARGIGRSGARMKMQATYELVLWDYVLGNATANLISGRPDCHIHVSWHRTPEAAVRALRRNTDCRIRVRGERTARLHGCDVYNHCGGRNSAVPSAKLVAKLAIANGGQIVTVTR